MSTTFTKSEAIALVNQGVKVTHSNCEASEFITRNWRDGFLQDENGVLKISTEFFKYQPDNGYTLFVEEVVCS